MEEIKTSIVARFFKKISKQLSDWGAIMCVTADVHNLPTSIKPKDGKAFITITGYNLPQIEGCNVRFFGNWVTTKYGTQLKSESYEIIPPDTEKGLIKFLSSKAFPGIGLLTAKRMVDMFSLAIIDIIESSPNKLLAVKGITPSKLAMFVASYKEVQNYSRLAAFLAPYGISGDAITRISKELGKDSIQKIEDNPYTLQNISGIGFKTCDRIARGLGVSLDSYKRIEGGIIDRLKTLCDGEGNMFADINDLYRETLKLLNEGLDPAPINNENFKNSLELMVKKRIVVIRKERDVYLFQYDQAESKTARKMLWLLENEVDESDKKKIEKELEKYSSSSSIELSIKQKQAVKLSLSNRISVITGGPGTGKSTIQMAIISVYKNVFGKDVTLMAPTGKASRRMAECTGLDASTIHSKLHIYQGMDKTPVKINSGLVIIDEVSMVDGILINNVLEAIADKNVHLILIGDIDQLPSVGPGAVLGEVISSGVIPTTRLTEIFRQKDGGIIVDNAIKINNGRYDLKFDQDFMLLQANNEEEAKKLVLEEYQKEVKERGIDNVALLSPLRKSQSRFTVVSDELNKELQNAINPMGDGKIMCKFHNKEFRTGDKVMQWKNTETSSNGDIGEIISIYEDPEIGILVEIIWDNGNKVVANKEDLETIDLAYAMSVHKSQGSEYDCVIIPMLSCQFSRLHKRNLLYTGVTRAKKKVIIVGDTYCISRCIAQSDTNKRNTLLADRLVVNSKKEETNA